MENENLIVGLDIGTTKICAIIGRKNEYGKLEVLGMGKAVSDGVIRGIVTNIDKTVNSIQKAVNEASEMSNVDIGEVIVGIAGQHIRSSIHHGVIIRNPKDDEITVEDVRRLANDMENIVVPPGNSIIHVMPQDYTVDYEEGIRDPVGMSGARLEADFHIITAQSAAINNIDRCVKRANLQSKALILEPLASSLSVLSDMDKEAGVCLVDIGGGTTDVAIFYENIIRHTAVIPFGGNIITADIKEGCMVMQHQAELLKTKFGRAIAEEANPNEIVSIPGLRNRPPKEISVRNLASIIQARMEEIIEMVQSEIVASGVYKKLAGGIVLTGGGSLLHGVGPLFEYLSGLDTRIGYPNEHLGRSKIEDVKSPMY
ncbi:MAG: cell division protein FtsA, partial [Cyclobacteriaceae bacterium]